MQLRTILATLFVGSTFAAAQPGGPADPPPEPPPPEEAPTPPAPVDEKPAPPPEAPTPTEPAPVVTAPPGVVPPITINITNNNTGNNSNTNTQSNEQSNAQSNTQTNTQTNTAPVTVTTPVTVSTPVTTHVAPPPIAVDGDRGRHPTIERIQMIAPKHARAKWLAIGVTGGEDGPGVRASLDLLGRGPFTIGIAASASAPEGHHHGGGDGSASAVAYLAYTRSIGRLDVRAQIGFGVGTSAGGGGRDTDRGDTISPTISPTIARTVGGTETPTTNGRAHPEIAPRAEAALLVALPLTRRLGLVAGPILSATHDRGDPLDVGRDGHHDKPEVDARFMAGLRFGF